MWQGIHQFLTFWKVGYFGKSTNLRRNALSTTQMLTYWLHKVYSDVPRDPPIFDFLESGKFWKVYGDMAGDPPIFDFLESGKVWKVYNSTKKCAINNSDAYLLTSQSLQQFGNGCTNFWLFGKWDILESLQFYEEMHYQQLRCILTTNWLKKVYGDMVGDPPIFYFLENRKLWKVYNSTKNRAINNSDSY